MRILTSSDSLSAVRFPKIIFTERGKTFQQFICFIDILNITFDIVVVSFHKTIVPRKYFSVNRKQGFSEKFSRMSERIPGKTFNFKDLRSMGYRKNYS